MNSIKNLLIGSGISSFIYFLDSQKKIQVFSSNKDEVVKSNNFYEYDTIGGNTNIWGGYINYKRHKKFLRNKKYKKIFQSNILKISKIFNQDSRFSNTYCIMGRDNKIFRLDKKMFKKKLTEKKIERIVIKKKLIELISSENESVFTSKAALCIGNLSLLKLMHHSDLIKPNDTISFEDGSCNYVLNLFINQNKNYYIPMPLKFIIEKLLLNKSNTYQMLSDSLILQKFSQSIVKHQILCKDLLGMKKKKVRYFLSNHIANLRINSIPIRKFIRQKSKRIDVYCSGTVKKYLPGPIIQDLIFDIINDK
jgi:hypothetical protein